MFIKNFLEYEKRKNELKNRTYDNNRIVSHGLSAWDKYFYERNNTMISKIVHKIEEKTGWEYFTDRFLFPSDFSYENGTINFTVNSVGNGYTVSDDLNERELLFLEENYKLLQRLHELEDKRDMYITKAKMANPNVIPMETVKAHRSRLLDEDFLNDWVGHEAIRFSSRYGSDGINRLVTVLNGIADTDSLEDYYSMFQKTNIPVDYKRELLRWASCLGVRGNRLLEKFNYDRDRIARIEDSYYDSFMHDESEFIFRYKK